MRTVLLVLLLAVAAPAWGDDKPKARGWTYRVRLESDLSRARVLLTFTGFGPKRLALVRQDAMAALQFTRHPMPDGAPRFRIERSKPGIVPILTGSDYSISYHVDLRALARITKRGERTRFSGRDVVTRAGQFLLHPPVWPSDVKVRVILVMPDGIQAAVPWTPDKAASQVERFPTYTLPRHAMAPFARIAFGRFTSKRLPIPGGEIIYTTLEGPRRVTDAGIRRYLSTAMGAVSDLFAGPPAPRTHVLLQPLVPGRGRPIVYGRATLAGGPQLHAMLSGTTTDDRLPGEWITIHEMIHLGMPVTTLADRWFGEGFVSYYQEVLRARVGIITPQQAWNNLHAWMERGRASGGRATLAVESRRMTDRYAYHRVYWGGAALALKMDAAIRSQSRGRQSLDDVMRLFHRRFQTPGTAIDALVLMRHADALIGMRLCEPMARHALSSSAFPDLRPTYSRLGLALREGRMQMLTQAPDIRHRDAIMRGGGR